ncbi:DUF1269 domain-containing protein [Acidiferrobacter thiooxydans]|jgi:hypothetical protein|nr:DUF1269 domain-containing protein [Acidiferrobacter thiooxydans]UEO00681.1 DUF1269 domain-containing protein [Acidiferrobacter thiooxydans]
MAIEMETTPDAGIAIFNTHIEAENAIKLLSRSGVDIKKLSIIGKGYHSEEQPLGFYTVGDRMKVWGGLGAFWGGLWGLLFGSAFFFIPGIGPLLAAGPIISMIVGAGEGAVVVGGLSALGAGLYTLGFTKHHIIKYETELKANKYLLIVHGNAAERAQVAAILTADKSERAAVEA